MGKIYRVPCSVSDTVLSLLNVISVNPHHSRRWVLLFPFLQVRTLSTEGLGALLGYIFSK